MGYEGSQLPLPLGDGVITGGRLSPHADMVNVTRRLAATIRVAFSIERQTSGQVQPVNVLHRFLLGTRIPQLPVNSDISDDVDFRVGPRRLGTPMSDEKTGMRSLG